MAKRKYNNDTKNTRNTSAVQRHGRATPKKKGRKLLSTKAVTWVCVLFIGFALVFPDWLSLLDTRLITILLAVAGIGGTLSFAATLCDDTITGFLGGACNSLFRKFGDDYEDDEYDYANEFTDDDDFDDEDGDTSIVNERNVDPVRRRPARRSPVTLSEDELDEDDLDKVGTILCPACGCALYKGAKFCYECGKRIPEENVCGNCHTVLPKGARFCLECGTPVATPNHDGKA